MNEWMICIYFIYLFTRLICFSINLGDNPSRLLRLYKRLLPWPWTVAYFVNTQKSNADLILLAFIISALLYMRFWEPAFFNKFKCRSVERAAWYASCQSTSVFIENILIKFVSGVQNFSSCSFWSRIGCVSNSDSLWFCIVLHFVYR
jgi:hypothetical protein